MTVQLGLSSLSVRMKEGGKCGYCREPIEVGDLYLIWRNRSRKSLKNFYITMHPSCVSDYLHKVWGRRQLKSPGKPPERNLSHWLDPVDKAIRDAQMQRRRFLVFKFMREERVERLAGYFTEIRKLGTEIFADPWAKGVTKRNWTNQQRADFNNKVKQVERYWKVSSE